MTPQFKNREYRQARLDEDANIELRNCPCCGSFPARVWHNDTKSVQCASCKMTTAGYGTWKQAAAAWNQREDDNVIAFLLRFIAGHGLKNQAERAWRKLHEARRFRNDPHRN